MILVSKSRFYPPVCLLTRRREGPCTNIATVCFSGLLKWWHTKLCSVICYSYLPPSSVINILLLGHSNIFRPFFYKSARIPSSWCRLHCTQQCCGSGFTYFWTSWIRIHKSEVWIRIRIRVLLSLSKNSKKKTWFLLFCDFLLTSYLWKMM